MIASCPKRTEAERAAALRLRSELRGRADAIIAIAINSCPLGQRPALLRSIIFAGSDRLATATCPVSTASLLCSTAGRLSSNVRPLSAKARAATLFSTISMEGE